MLKHTARLASMALLMFAASASPVTLNAAQQDTPLPMPDPRPPINRVIAAVQQDTPLPMPDPRPPVTQVI